MRRTRRLIKLVDDLLRTTDGASRWPAGAGGDQGRHRLLDNPAVGGGRSWTSIPRGRWSGWRASNQWCCAFKTRPNWIFTSQPGIAGLGRFKPRSPARAVRASDPGGDAPAGWRCRGYSTRGCGRGSRKTNPTSKKYPLGRRLRMNGWPIWRRLPGYPVVYVADRKAICGADRWPPPGEGTPADWLIRSKHNRKTTTGEKLWGRIAQSEALGRSNSPCRRRRIARPGGAADALSHGGHAAGARPTRRDRDRDLAREEPSAGGVSQRSSGGC